MINLLPPEAKESMAYARRNSALIKWAVATFIGILGIGAVVLAGQFYINLQTTAYADEVQRARASLKQQKLEETEAQITDIDSSVKLALQVLSKQILFSKLLQQIGAVMPPGSSLQNLSIGNVEGALDLQALAADYQTATQIQVNLTDPSNKLFEEADIISISCSPENAADSAYPCQVNIRALFASDSPFLFSTNTAGGNR